MTESACAVCGLTANGGFRSATRCAITSCPRRTIECAAEMLIEQLPELVPPIVRSKHGQARHLSDYPHLTQPT